MEFLGSGCSNSLKNKMLVLFLLMCRADIFKWVKIPWSVFGLFHCHGFYGLILGQWVFLTFLLFIYFFFLWKLLWMIIFCIRDTKTMIIQYFVCVAFCQRATELRMNYKNRFMFCWIKGKNLQSYEHHLMRISDFFLERSAPVTDDGWLLAVLLKLVICYNMEGKLGTLNKAAHG